MPYRQTKGVSAGTNVTDGRQDLDVAYEAPKMEIMKSSGKSRSGELRTRSGLISCRPERLGINQE